MISSEQIEKIKSLLHDGDKAEIARRAGVHKVTVFNVLREDKQNEYSEDTRDKVMLEALKLIEERRRKKEEIENKLNLLD